MKRGDSSNLNLLPSQAKFQAARMKLEKTIHYFMSLVGVLWIAVIIVILFLFFGSNYILNLQIKKYNQALNSFQSLSSEIVVGQLLKYRAKVLGEVLNDRFEYSTAFEKINSLFGDNVVVANFQLEDNKQFSLALKTAEKVNVDHVEEVVEDINLGKVEGVSKAVLKGSTWDNNDWLIKMEVSLK